MGGILSFTTMTSRSNWVNLWPSFLIVNGIDHGVSSGSNSISKDSEKLLCSTPMGKPTKKRPVEAKGSTSSRDKRFPRPMASEPYQTPTKKPAQLNAERPTRPMAEASLKGLARSPSSRGEILVEPVMFGAIHAFLSTQFSKSEKFSLSRPPLNSESKDYRKLDIRLEKDLLDFLLEYILQFFKGWNPFTNLALTNNCS